MKSKDYWGTRERDMLYNRRLEVAEKQLAKEYQRCFTKTKRDLVNLYNEISSNADEVLVSDLYRYNKYYDLLNNLNAELVRLGEKEIAITELALSQLYESNSKQIRKELGFNSNFANKDVATAINSVWATDNKKWSERVWNGKQQLEETVKQGLVDCIVRGDSKDRLVKELMTKYNQAFNRADRLVRTELAYVQNRSTLDTYQEAGIEYYQVLTAGDDNVCSVCEDSDEAIRVDQAIPGITMPPFHPNCRCALLAVFNKEE